MEKSIPCTPHNTHGCHCLWTPGQRVAAGLPAMPFAMDSATADSRPKSVTAMDALSNDMHRLLEKAIVMGSRKPASPLVRRAAPVARDTYGNVASHEDINVLYARLKEEKRNEPAYVYEQD
jgi:hypothetical protein